MARQGARGRALVLATGLALAVGLVACGGSSDDDPAPALPVEPPAPATPEPALETPPSPIAPPDPSLPEPVEPSLPKASAPTEPAPRTTGPVEPPAPASPTPPVPATPIAPPAAPAPPTATEVSTPAAAATPAPAPLTTRRREAEIVSDIELARGEAITEFGTYVLNVETGAASRIRGRTDLQRFVMVEAVAPDTWFELPSPVGGWFGEWSRERAWESPDGRSLLLFDGEAFHAIGLDRGAVTAVRWPAGMAPFGASSDGDASEYHIGVFSSGDGFAVIGRDTREDATCRVVRYDWAAQVLSDASFACAGDIWDGKPWQGPYLSPDGRRIAAITLTKRVSGVFTGSLPRLTAVSVFDAVTGDALFRVKGAFWDLLKVRTLSSFKIYPHTLWLPHSEGLVVRTVARDRIVTADGRWSPLPNTLQNRRFVPGPGEPLRFLLSNLTVADSAGTVLASVGVEIDSPWGISVASRWGATNNEVFFSVHDNCCGSLTILRSVLPPVIERPPFDDRLLLRVVADGTCLNIRDEPLTESARVTCLPDGSIVETVESQQSHSGRWFEEGARTRYEFGEGTHTAISDSGCSRGQSCVWLRVRSDDGAEGWALSDYLRWAKGEPAPAP